MTSIYFDGMEDNFNQFLLQTKHQHIVLLADANTHGFCVHRLMNSLPVLKKAQLIVVPQGESNKTLETCCLIWDKLDEYQAGRSTLLINIGGGMITDLGGFAASVYKRGIDFIHIPTTLLSMVDACYGGKTGIDYHHIKNHLGTFSHPLAIYIRPQFLETLDSRILVSGIAESIKHALIASEHWWNDMQVYTLNDFISSDAIRRSVDIKRNLIAQDEKDENERQRLNFGHTLGHAIESYALDIGIQLYHGEAVMLGMFHEIFISERLLDLSPKVSQEFQHLFHTFFPDLKLNYTFQDLEPFLIRDKKAEHGVNMSLLKHPGDCKIKVAVDMNTIIQSLVI